MYILTYKSSLYQLLPIKVTQVVSLPTCIHNAPLPAASETPTIPSDEFRGIYVLPGKYQNSTPN
jgi:hypothetical protein